MTLLARTAPPATTPRRSRHATATLAAAVLGFFVVTLDAVVVNVALPSIGADLGGGITGLQWVVDGYTLLFAALLLSAGAFSDRAGARRACGTGIGLFVAASAACGLAPAIGVLVAARFVQGAAAAVIMPSSMALIGQGYPNPVQRARAVEGEGLVQARGEAVTRIRPGDVVNVAGDEWHWHGAAPDHSMTHLSLTEGDTEWGEHVTDTEYSQTPR
jgi:DHA2 family methylenomycin A resistance protein-like MFS transporter